MRDARLGRGLVALAASAITAVYAAGYVNTQAADQTLGSAAAAAAATPASGQALAVVPVQLRTAIPRIAAVAAQAIKDGAHSGVGRSPRGDVQVLLSIQGGRIGSVKITGATTQYPTPFIANLPGEVVSRQKAQVDMISGATFSSLEFRGAVQQALQRAQG